MTFLPKLMSHTQLAKSQDYSETPTGFLQLLGIEMEAPWRWGIPAPLPRRFSFHMKIILYLQLNHPCDIFSNWKRHINK